MATAPCLTASEDWFPELCGVPVETQVHAVQPYTSNELSLMSLPRILHHFNVKSQNCSSGNPLLYLYPRIPKDSVFEGSDTGELRPPCRSQLDSALLTLDPL